MAGQSSDFRFRSIAAPALIPSLLFAIGEGAVIPIVPAIATSLGADLALAGFIAALIMVGTMLGDIPSGWLVARIGERRSMQIASVAALGGAVLALLATSVLPSLFLFAISVFMTGLSASVFGLARHALLTSVVPKPFRARALSLLGGTFRAGWFIGPFLAAGVIVLAGQPQVVFWLQIVFSAIAILIVAVFPDPTRHLVGPKIGEELVAEEALGLFSTIWLYRGVLLRLGSGVALIAALRSSRMILLPLWALGIGLSEADMALIIGIGSALDFALFYTSGQIMDRWGRLWSAVPSMLGMGTALFVLAFTLNLPGAAIWFIVITMVMGVANGIGSGIIMTLGADVAPKSNPAPFLGAFRFTGDAGAAAAPLLVSVVIAVASLPIAAGLIGALAYVSVVLMLRYIPRYIGPHHRTPSGTSLD